MTMRPAVMELLIQNNLSVLISSDKSDDYYELANCSPSDSHLFFSEDKVDENQALQICRICPIKMQCLNEALANNLEGVWGGTTDSDRESLSKAATNLERLTLEDAREELKFILRGEVRRLSTTYEVDERTIHRWRSKIQETPAALELLGKR